LTCSAATYQRARPDLDPAVIIGVVTAAVQRARMKHRGFDHFAPAIEFLCTVFSLTTSDNADRRLPGNALLWRQAWRLLEEMAREAAQLKAAPRRGRGAHAMIRLACGADIPRLVEMGLRFRRESEYVDVLAENADKMTQLATQFANSGCLVVSERDGQIVGMLGYVLFPISSRASSSRVRCSGGSNRKTAAKA
jgi:hypothetical protein